MRDAYHSERDGSKWSRRASLGAAACRLLTNTKGKVFFLKRLERDFPGKQNALISRNGTCQVEILFLYAEHVEVRAKSGCVVENS